MPAPPDGPAFLRLGQATSSWALAGLRNAGVERLHSMIAATAVAVASTIPLWASIVISVAPIIIAVAALMIGSKQQAKTLQQQRDQLTETFKQQREQLSANLDHERQQQEQLLRHERQQDDLSEVRSVLDDAARALNEADRCHRDIYDDLGNADKKETLKHAGRTLDEVNQRLAIRFGSDHEVTAEMTTCVGLSLQVFGATLDWSLKDYDFARDKAKRAMTDFEPAWRRFISAATRHAGVDLPAEATTA